MWSAGLTRATSSSTTCRQRTIRPLSAGAEARREGAEALVHRRARWEAITSIAVRDQCCEQTVLAILREANANVSVEKKPEWYF
ncbi:DUF4433 domain-containing protein [Micrococcales bacterium 31B]|nr:DUF4433 domain-containing protein [Micrococcales bacterium 31B]